MTAIPPDSPAGQCPELEVLFNELAEGQGPALLHAQSCERCKAILEEHRQLEKDLYRLADPLPPPDLVHKVMAKVAAEPKPIASEVKAGLFILAAAVIFAVIGFIGAGATAGSLGASVAGFMIHARTFLSGVGHAALTIWQTAATPLIFGSLLLLFASLFGLRKLAAAAPSSPSSSEQPA